MMEIMARRQPWSDSVDIVVGLRDRISGRMSVARPIVMVEHEPSTMITEPTLSLDNTTAQRLMDELWNCGLRPSEGSGSAGSLAATERHLKDMRAIAIGLLRKDDVQV